MRLRYLVIVVLASSGGCSTKAPPRTPGMEAFGVDITTAELRQRLYRYERVFAAVIQHAADEIFTTESDTTIREMSLRWKINAVPEMQSAVFQLDPLGGLADAWGLTAQMERFFTTGNGSEIFGNSQPIAVEASRKLHAEVHALTFSVVGEEKAREVEPKLRVWLEENPILDIAFGRRSTAIDAATVTAAEWGSGTFQTVGQIEDLVRDLSDRSTIYASQIPELARSHAQLLVIEMNRQVLASVWEDIDSLVRSIASVDQRIQEIDTFLLSSPELIANERVVILAALQEELETALDDVDRQRLATIEALSAEREAIMSDVDELRSLIVDDVRGVATAATTDIDEIVERQSLTLISKSESLVDMVFWRALILIAFGLVGLALVLRLSRPTTST